MTGTVLWLNRYAEDGNPSCESRLREGVLRRPTPAGGPRLIGASEPHSEACYRLGVIGHDDFELSVRPDTALRGTQAEHQVCARIRGGGVSRQAPVPVDQRRAGTRPDRVGRARWEVVVKVETVGCKTAIVEEYVLDVRVAVPSL